ncbi:hypothetical protein PQQ51_33500 [Paraburkholderia xenovorans]|uniref:hypothetical protein n=1 Tax=Paraburkholderia xenovorans TaxID=36873 RepID=UPI0038BDA946
MNDDDPLRPGHPHYNEAVALELTVRTMRRAQGKKNLEDVARGTPEWEAVAEDFLRDLRRAVGDDPDRPG